MRVCVFEDIDEKFYMIRNHLVENGVRENDVERVSVLADALHVLRKKFDLIVVDLFMPFSADGEIQRAGGDIATLLERADCFDAEILIVTEYFLEAKEEAQAFARRGCVTADFAKEDVWKAALVSLMSKVQDKHCYDFIALCAVDVEFDGLLGAGSFVPKRVKRDKLTYEEVTLGEYSGALIQLPRMGLVNAATVTSKILEKYSPRVMFMSGICGGTNDGKMGKLLVSDVSWEYQVGKWTDAGFLHEPYQESLDPDIRNELKYIIRTKNLLEELEKGLGNVPMPTRKYNPELSVFASGSAVVAKRAFLNHVKKQHRKISGLDMEVFAFLSAARQASRSPIVFAAKAVVDRADRTKSNRLHKYASHVSAAFCLRAVKSLLERK